MIQFNTAKKVLPKPYINVGALLDIPTGSLMVGSKGETFVNGGLGPITAIVGAGNNFKSTILHYMLLSATSKIKEAVDTNMVTYDTEMNMSLDRLESLASNFDNLKNNIITSDDPIWTIIDKQTPGNEFAMEVNKYTDAKIAEKRCRVDFQPFTNPYTKKTLNMCIPSFIEIDSLSELEAKSSMDMLAKDLDSSETNTFAMKQGLFKTKFLSTVPVMATESSTYFLCTAQLGEKNEMKSGPAMFSPPTKELQFLRQGEHIKGVSPKFFFLTHVAMYAHTASALINPNTKLAEYPLEDESQKTDLNIVRLTQLRCKNGPSGYTVSIIVSQSEGVLPTLTEFHYIKENNRFGIGGSLTNYSLDIYPEVSLSRTTVRSKINKDPKLRRAINILSELFQLKIFQPQLFRDGNDVTPKQLYEDIKNLGYDWDILLQTRGYWTLDQYDNKVPFLSVVDLLNMRNNKYHPYFLDKNKKLLTKYIRKD